MNFEKVKSVILRWWVYFRRAHNNYLAFALSFLNFIVIQYRLLIQYVPFLHLVFSSLLAFALSFFLVYVPAAIVIGWLDYKRLSVEVEQLLATQANPYARDIALALYLYMDGKVEEAKKVLEKWLPENRKVRNKVKR